MKFTVSIYIENISRKDIRNLNLCQSTKISRILNKRLSLSVCISLYLHTYELWDHPELSRSDHLDVISPDFHLSFLSLSHFPPSPPSSLTQLPYAHRLAGEASRFEFLNEIHSLP